jgi:hypothetical protein
MRWLVISLAFVSACERAPAGEPSRPVVVQVPRDAAVPDTRDARDAPGLLDWLDPPVARAACEAGCRNFATLMFWQRADVEVAAAPEDRRAALRRAKVAELTGMLAAGIDFCVDKCVKARNAAQVACMTTAKTAEAANACVAD